MNNRITQEQLGEYADTLAKLERASLTVSTLKKKLEKVESMLTLLFTSGATIQKGQYSLQMETKVGRTAVPWKDLFISHMVASHDENPKIIEQRAKDAHPAGETKVLRLIEPGAR